MSSIEDIQRRREAESIERSESRAQILEEREEREAVEDHDDLNAIRTKLAATTMELQQKEDELDLKEIDNLIQEHDRVVDVVEQEWRGEVEEARSQAEELEDVRFLRMSFPFCISLYHVLSLRRARKRSKGTAPQHHRTRSQRQ